jgi:superfamily II DNA or RNA helicase
VDEAHHATAASYRRVLDHFDVFAPDTRKLLVGFTATPKRGDGQGLDEVFEDITFSKTLPQMIGAGYLAPVAGYRVETEVDLSGVRTRMGDYVSSQLADAVNVEERNRIVVEVHRRHLSGRPTLCFCVDVAHAEALAAAFRAAGVRCASVTGELDRAVRARTLEAFRRGDLKVVTNCMVLTEGYDEPSVAGIILARPTRSGLLYTQMIGRGTRLHPGKDDVTVIDIVDVTRDHKLVTLPSLFGLAAEFDLEGRTTTQAQDAIRWVETHRPWVSVDAVRSLSELRYRCQKIDLLDLQTPAELAGVCELAWAGTAAGAYRLGLARGETVSVSPTILGDWEVLLRRGTQEIRLAREGSPTSPDARVGETTRVVCSW